MKQVVELVLRGGFGGYGGPGSAGRTVWTGTGTGGTCHHWITLACMGADLF